MIQIQVIIEEVAGGRVSLRSAGSGNATELECYYADCIATAIHSGGEYARKQCGAMVEEEVAPFKITCRDVTGAESQTDEAHRLRSEARLILYRIGEYEASGDFAAAYASAELLGNVYRQLDLIRIRDGQENQKPKG
jgi:hypothetical protein